MSRNEEQRVIAASDAAQLGRVAGPSDIHLRLIAESTGAKVTARGDSVFVSGDAGAVDQAALALTSLLDSAGSSGRIGEADVRALLGMLGEANTDEPELISDAILMSADGLPVRARSLRQRRYVSSIISKTVTFGVGPAGTGKTYLAVATAVRALQKKQVHRIVLTRPAVEAGERLGFLPGDLEAKINPYLRPLYDALYEFLGAQVAHDMMAEHLIEIAPLAFMRGRTLNRSFVILDEAQNTTREQMKMFLTRLGAGSTMVINGDISQIDLRGASSGLKQAVRILERNADIGTIRFDRRDVVRHALVQDIIAAYEKEEQR